MTLTRGIKRPLERGKEEEGQGQGRGEKAVAKKPRFSAAPPVDAAEGSIWGSFFHNLIRVPYMGITDYFSRKMDTDRKKTAAAAAGQE